MDSTPYEPITFFEPPTSPTKCKPRQNELLEEFIPSFCDASLPEFPQTTISYVAAPLPEVSQFGIPFFPNSSTMSGTAFPVANEKTTKRASTRQQPKAYDIAMELLSAIPLRMVDNALFAFDGRVYRFVSAPVMNRLIMQVCRRYVQIIGDASIIERIYKVIQAEPTIVFRPRGEDCPFISLEDGLLDLRTMTLTAWSPVPFVTVQINGNYTRGQQSTCPVFDQYLNQVTMGDPSLIDRIWECIGYALVPDTKAKAFILLQGVPDSGKSLLGSVIAALVDEDLVTSLDISGMGERFAPGELVGKQLCLSLDMPSGTLDSKAVSVFKNLTGGDVVTADVKYQPRIKFRCPCTFIMATNHALLTRDHDPALMRRAVTIPFRVSVEKDAQRHDLKAAILRERDSIVYRALQAYQRLRQKSYRFSGHFEPNEVTFGEGSAQDNITDLLWAFCRSHCIKAPNSFVSTAILYEAFYQSTGIQWTTGLNRFSAELFYCLTALFPGSVQKDRRRTKGSSSNPERGFSGIALVTSPHRQLGGFGNAV